jgi:hypothetical protein|tara:strand:- start:7487 stop:7729 length:243 start_codon:yes stop_codon:yes gene_type:complete
MAFVAADLKKVAGGAVGLWYYSSTDAIGTIDDADYFLGATNELKVSDVIIAVGATGGTRTVDMLVVQTNTGSALTTVLGT